ncbi:DNA-directed DNA polymerase, partial [Chytriomyces confervae]
MIDTANTIKAGNAFTVDKLLIVSILMSLPDSGDWQTTVESLKTLNDKDLTLEKIKRRLLERATEVSKDRSRKPNSDKATAFHVGSKPANGRKCFACGKQNHYIRDCRNKAAVERYKSERAKKDTSKESGTSNNKESGNYAFSAFSAEQQDQESGIWYKDAGASRHYTFQREILSNYRPVQDSVQLADRSSLEIQGVGSMTCKTTEGNTVTLHEVFHVPKMKVNLLSTAQLDKKGIEEHCLNGVTTFKHKGNTIFTSNRVGNRWIMNWQVLEATSPNNAYLVADKLWHRRFCHIGYSTLKQVAQHVHGMSFGKDSRDHGPCEACNLGKAQRKVFSPTGNPRAKHPMDLLHLDFNIVNIPGRNGELAVLGMTDDHSNMRFMFPMKRKSGQDIVDVIKNWLPWAERVTGRKVKAFRHGGEKELTLGHFKAYCGEHGIEQQITVPYEHEQNGTAEVTNRVITTLARTTLIESGLPKSYWPDAILTATFVANRSMAPDKRATCVEEFTDVKPDVSMLRVFGSRCWVKVPVEKTGGSHKLDPRSLPGRFLRYENYGSAYRVLLDDRREVIATSVTWDEGATDGTVKVPEITPLDQASNSGVQEAPESDDSDSEDDIPVPEPPAVPEPVQETQESSSDDDVAPDTPPSLRPKRNRRPPGEWWILDNRNSIHYAFMTMDEALQGPDAQKWKAAVEKELTNFKHFKAFELVDLPPGKKAIGSKLFPNIKKDGTFKVRGVAKGFTQIQGVDFTDTFAPVAKAQAIRVFLVICNARGWVIQQGDVRAAFLNSNLEEEVYMQQFKGFEEELNPPGQPQRVYKLLKALYGTKQAGRAWRKRLAEFLLKNGFKPLMHEQCIFYKGSWDKDLVLVVVWVDDVLAAGDKSSPILQDFWKMFKKEFEVEDLGYLENYIGMHVQRDLENKKLYISQERALQEVLLQFNMQDSKPRDTPLPSGLVMKRNTELPETDKPYRSLVGCLMYPMIWTRPDIAFAASQLGQFSSGATDEHWQAGMELLRFIQGSKSLALEYQFRGSYDLVCYTDADWANDLQTAKSVYGYIFFLDGNPVSWKSKKIQSVCTSTTHSELEGFFHAAQEGQWLSGLLHELGIIKEKKFKIFCDNKAVLDIITSEKALERTKHLIVKVEFLRELIRNGTCQPEQVKSQDNTADIFTKSLGKILFSRHQAGCGLVALDEGECSNSDPGSVGVVGVNNSSRNASRSTKTHRSAGNGELSISEYSESVVNDSELGSSAFYT